MEWESGSLCCSHTYPRQGCRFPRRCSGWELEFRIVEQSQGKGCCWLWRDRLKGWEGGDCGGKCLWRKAGQPWKQSDTAESRVGGAAITIASLSPHTSIGSWTIQRLAHQMPDAVNYRVGPTQGTPLSDWCTDLQSRTPARGTSLCVWCAKQQRRTPGNGAL